MAKCKNKIQNFIHVFQETPISAFGGSLTKDVWFEKDSITLKYLGCAVYKLYESTLPLWCEQKIQRLLIWNANFQISNHGAQVKCSII